MKKIINNNWSFHEAVISFIFVKDSLTMQIDEFPHVPHI